MRRALTNSVKTVNAMKRDGVAQGRGNENLLVLENLSSLASASVFRERAQHLRAAAKDRLMGESADIIRAERAAR